MAKGLTNEQNAALAENQVKTRLLLIITMRNNDILRLLENDTLEALEVQGEAYLGVMVHRSEVTRSTEVGKESCSITISDISQQILSLVGNEGDVLTNASCVIQEVIFDLETDTMLDEPITIFNGIIDSPIFSYKGELKFNVDRKLGGHSADVPSQRYDVNCQWLFKGKRCQYNGAEMFCDKTLTSCLGYGNVLRFGGYPSLPEESKIR